MPEGRFGCGSTPSVGSREVCCIETDRIYDSCRDRDCFENIRVVLTDYGNDIIARTNNIRAKDAFIAWTYIGVDPIRFNRGFFTVNIRYFIKIVFEACLGPKPQEFEGVVAIDKRVVLYGGEKNVNVFRSNPDSYCSCSSPDPVGSSTKAPVAVVEATDPIILTANVYDRITGPQCLCCCACEVPQIVTTQFECPISDNDAEGGRFLAVSLGLFSVIRLVRPTQILVNATEYCVPDKECLTPREENPCAIFNSMAFPSGEFSTPIPNPPSQCSRCN